MGSLTATRQSGTPAKSSLTIPEHRCGKSRTPTIAAQSPLQSRSSNSAYCAGSPITHRKRNSSAVPLISFPVFLPLQNLQPHFAHQDRSTLTVLWLLTTDHWPLTTAFLHFLCTPCGHSAAHCTSFISLHRAVHPNFHVHAV